MASAMFQVQSSPWFSRVTRRATVRARLICLPFAGGGADAYREWGAWLPESVEVWPVQLPGRGARLMEAPVTDVAALIAQLAEEARPLLDRPFALFGHSMGAVLAFELAHHLRDSGLPVPSALILSGRPAPEHPPIRLRHRMDDAALLAELREFKGTPTEALDNAELMQLLLPTIRADFRLIETHRADPGRHPLSMPFLVCGGADDALAPAGMLRSWLNETEGKADILLFPGGHFYFASVEPEFGNAILATLNHHVLPDVRADDG